MNKLAITLGLALVLGAMGCSDEGDGGDSKAQAQANAAGAGGDHSLPGDPEAGADVYARVCAACHGQDGKGNGGITGADFVNDDSRLSKPNEELLASIKDGVDANPPMPPQDGILSDEEMKDALAYIRTEFGQ